MDRRVLLASIFSVAGAAACHVGDKFDPTLLLVSFALLAAAALIHARGLAAQIVARGIWWAFALVDTIIALSEVHSAATLGVLVATVGALFAAGTRGIDRPADGSRFVPVAFRRLLLVSTVMAAGEALFFGWIAVLAAPEAATTHYPPALAVAAFCGASAAMIGVGIVGLVRLRVWGLFVQLVVQIAFVAFFASSPSVADLRRFGVGYAPIVNGLALVAMSVPVLVAIARRRAPDVNALSARIGRALPALILGAMVAAAAVVFWTHHPLYYVD